MVLQRPVELAELLGKWELSEGRAREESTFGPGSTRILVGNVVMQLGYGLLLSRNYPFH
jgi:hypothetical protein